MQLHRKPKKILPTGLREFQKCFHPSCESTHQRRVMGGPRLHGFLHGTNSRSPANYEDLCETGPASHLEKPEDLEHPSPNLKNVLQHQLLHKRINSTIVKMLVPKWKSYSPLIFKCSDHTSNSPIKKLWVRQMHLDLAV